MSVGNQATKAGIDQNLSALAIQWRDLATRTRQYQQQLNQLGLTGLEAAGYTAQDAPTVLTQINYMATPAGCYFGTVQQGGSGGTGAVLFDFDNELCPLWADQ